VLISNLAATFSNDGAKRRTLVVAGNMPKRSWLRTSAVNTRISSFYCLLLYLFGAEIMVGWKYEPR